jgi:hypothetical protein
MVLAVESGVSSVTTLRQQEGFNTWEGYSPFVFSIYGYVPVANPENIQYDAVVLYLKDLDGTTTGWNYTTVSSIRQQMTNAEDKRYSRTIYSRFQRDNFGTEYTICTTDFDIAYIENVWFDGNPNEYVIPDDIGRAYRKYVSVRDTSGQRHTFTSAIYYQSFVYPITIPADSLIPSVSIDSGNVASVTNSADAREEVLTPTVMLGGSLFETVVPLSEEETLVPALTLQGSLYDIVISTSSDPETLAPAVTLEGAMVDAIVSDDLYGDILTLTLTLTGSLETV